MDFSWLPRWRRSYLALAHADGASVRSWSSAGRAVARLGLLALHPARHHTVVAALRAPSLEPMHERQPQLPYKYLRRRYLASNLSRATRAAILAHHYAVATERLTPSFLQGVAEGGVRLWASHGAAMAHTIDLRLAHPVDNEGELTLEYSVDGRTVSMLSFSIAPASVFGLVGADVLLVSRMQNLGSDPALLRAAAKDQHDIAPRYALAAALQGVAVAFDVADIVGVSLVNQVSYATDPQSMTPASYDDFYRSLGGREQRPGFFAIAVPFPEKDIALVSASHRRRTRHKRAQRQAIAELALAQFAACLREPLNPNIRLPRGDPGAPVRSGVTGGGEPEHQLEVLHRGR